MEVPLEVRGSSKRNTERKVQVTIIDLTDPVAMQDAIENGYVWSAPAGAQEKACQLIAGGKVPMPGYLPRYAKARIAELGKDPNSIGFVANDGEGPA